MESLITFSKNTLHIKFEKKLFNNVNQYPNHQKKSSKIVQGGQKSFHII
ncbi:hypothetical protein J2X17_002803 [Flavobacterium aquidurense]|nr:hypothetical protein [Flavobacterium aquidurense]